MERQCAHSTYIDMQDKDTVNDGDDGDGGDDDNGDHAGTMMLFWWGAWHHHGNARQRKGRQWKVLKSHWYAAPWIFNVSLTRPWAGMNRCQKKNHRMSNSRERMSNLSPNVLLALPGALYLTSGTAGDRTQSRLFYSTMVLHTAIWDVFLQLSRWMFLPLPLSLLLMSPRRNSTQPHFQFAIHHNFAFNFYSKLFYSQLLYSDTDGHNLSCSSTGIAFSFTLIWPCQIDVLLGAVCQLFQFFKCLTTVTHFRVSVTPLSDVKSWRSVEASDLHPLHRLGDPRHRVAWAPRHLRRLACVVLSEKRWNVDLENSDMTMLRIITKPGRRETHEGKCLRCTCKQRILLLNTRAAKNWEPWVHSMWDVESRVGRGSWRGWGGGAESVSAWRLDAHLGILIIIFTWVLFASFWGHLISYPSHWFFHLPSILGQVEPGKSLS